jgi:hypothetical protein
MTLAAIYLAQLEREAAISQRVLARVPDGRQDWKPHEKSMAFGRLATLVATMPSWVVFVVRQDQLDLRPPGGEPNFRPPSWSKNSELVAIHERSIADAREALRGAGEEHLLEPWRLLAGGKVVAGNPRHVVLADTFAHLAHHRGQLSVYLRLSGVAVPSIYGPSADDVTF